jgi:hypothetical protein
MFGLQRSGTNFLEDLVKNNFNGKKLNDQRKSWKHSIDVPSIYDENTPTLIIHKNPYTWIESISLRNNVDWIKTQKKYPADQKTDSCFMIGEKQSMNIINLALTYRHFHETWLDKNHYEMKYEDLLVDKPREIILDQIREKYALQRTHKNWLIPKRGSVSQSRDYNANREEYYIRGVPQTLTGKQIAKVNEIIGVSLIRKMGYDVL